MKRFIATIILTSLLALSFPQQTQSRAHEYLTDYLRAEKLFKKAEQLSGRADFNDHIQKQQDELYSRALADFSTAGKKAQAAGNDSLHFHIFVRIGLINHYFDSIATAKENYLAAIRVKARIPHIQDSFLFKPYLFLGGILYDAHQFDSAFYYYQKAESIQSSYQAVLEESQRLYNKLGAMYYETGNYRLAKTYFEKALSTLSPAQSSYTSLMINYRINIASILVKLQDFQEARKMYEDLLHYKIYENEIWHNLGIIDNHLGNYRQAIEDFRKVNYSTGNKAVDLSYNLAVAFQNLGKTDSTNLYLQKAALETRRVNGDTKNTAFGLTLELQGDIESNQRHYAEALGFYQKAIIQFDISFNDTDVYRNPTQFTGFFSYINLFNSLTSKADVFNESFAANGELRTLEAALDAYRSAFQLVDYVEKTYESDESRLFLNHIKYSAHGKPIDICLELYERTKDKTYLEQAYYFDQRNKASILSLNLQLLQMQHQGGASSEMLQKESSLRSAITRLSIHAAQLTESARLRAVNREIGDLEIQLAGVQQRLNQDPKYSQLQTAGQIPDISALQKNILDNNTALISYHLSEKELLILIITKRTFSFHRQPIGKDFYGGVESYLTYLHQANDETNKPDNLVSSYLYTILVKPILPFTGKCRRLVIIPDDELNYLPFEALKNEEGHYLLESFSVQYQYSTALLNPGSHSQKKSTRGNLAFAPFTPGNNLDGYDVLRYSGDEVKDLGGEIYAGKNATKQNFLAAANQYGIIHLATHATVDDSLPARSFIAFYPSGVDSMYRLYAREIYDLKLDSTQLIILSACETGAGQLVRGEGLMSLSRAFAYAGCPNIITSLWKAEDKTTAFITKRLHFYLQKNYSNDEALRRAKLDLLHSDQLDPRFKRPQYWAHLVFIGDYARGKSSLNWLWIAGIALIIVVLFLIIKQKVPRRAGPRSS